MEEVKTPKEDEILEDESENTSESSDIDREEMRHSNAFQKKADILKSADVKRGLLEISQIKYGSATIVKNQLPTLQSRGATPTVRNLTGDKETKKGKPVL